MHKGITGGTAEYFTTGCYSHIFNFFLGLKRILDGIKILVEIRGKADIIKGLFAK